MAQVGTTTAGYLFQTTLTTNAALYATSGGVVSSSSGMTDGQVLIGSSAGVPTAATLTAGTGITITNGHNSVTIAVTAGSSVVETLTGNSGGAIPPSTGNIGTVGTGSITIAGAGNTLTTQLTGLTNHNVLIGAGTATITNVAPSATSGVPLISQGAAADPTFGTAVVAGGGTGAVTLTGVLTGNGTSAFTASTVTQHGVLVGGASNAVGSTAVGTTGQVLQANTGADPTYSTATYPSTTTVNQILYSSSANAVAGLATANNGVLTTGTSGIPVITALASDGQLIIGSGAGAPAAATLTAGTGITVTNGHNTITIAASASSLTWSDNSGTFTAVSNHGYFITAASTPTLPAAPSNGDVVAFIIDNASTCTVTGNAGQPIRIGAAVSAAAGTAANNARGDTLQLVYRSTNTTWLASSVIGTWSVT